MIKNGYIFSKYPLSSPKFFCKHEICKSFLQKYNKVKLPTKKALNNFCHTKEGSKSQGVKGYWEANKMMAQRAGLIRKSKEKEGQGNKKEKELDHLLNIFNKFFS